MSTIRALTPQDRTAWEPLWEAYQVFYEVDIPAETTNITWGRFHDTSEPMHAL
ncbi:MAG: GNAT family N-acetyltransferase, partial [Starkeya sp.]|nr:GNAT family N-acetyltransferase [Starkeya sp.]